MKRFFDRAHTRSARDFEPGTNVLVHNVRGQSVPGVVIQRLADRSYLVEFPNGARSLRNRKFLTVLPRTETRPEPSTNVTLLDSGVFPDIRSKDSTRSPVTAPESRPVSPRRVETMPQPPTRQAATPVLVSRPNPCSPPRPSTYVTRGGRRIVPTLRALNR
jgi:hypothetical protein